MTPLPEVFLSRPIAHRALHDMSQGRPENSPAAIRAAIAAGYGIEIDLQLSRDGRAMVFHDDTLDRLTAETGPVRGRSAEELGRIALAGTDEGIPSFAEVLALVAGRVPLLVELKDQHGKSGGADGVLEAAVAQDLAGYTGPLALMSFNPRMVRRLADLAPDWPRGLVTCAYDAEDWPDLAEPVRAHLRAIPDYEPAGCSFISHEANDLLNPRVAELMAEGARVLCWTIRSDEAEAEARKIAQNVTFEGYAAALPS